MLLTIKKNVCKAAICLLSIIFVDATTIEHAVAEQIQPILKYQLEKSENISNHHKKILSIFIDKYLPDCPYNKFRSSRIEDLFQIEDQDDGSYRINSSIVCDKSKDSPDMQYSGESVVINADGMLRVRNDTFQPNSDLASLLQAARARMKNGTGPTDEKEPTDEQIRRQHINHYLNKLDNDNSIDKLHRLIYRQIIKKYYPSCPDHDYENINSIKDVVWLSKFNDGYIAVLLVICDWKDAQAFFINASNKIDSKFTLPLGKYGFSPMPMFKVLDFTGDGKQELMYKKIFPTSSVPVFSTQTQIYKHNAERKTIVKVLDIETEMQDCSGIELKSGQSGKRKLVMLEILNKQGKIKAISQEDRMNCDEFSWGKSPVIIKSRVNKKESIYRWSGSKFQYVEE